MIKWRTKHLLTHWQGYIELSAELIEVDKESATIFFNALKRLPKEDIEFLADKYLKYIKKRTVSPCYGVAFSNVAATEKEMAEIYGMNQSDYSKKRIGIESKLQNYVYDIAEQYNDKRLEELAEFKLKTGRLFLKSYHPSVLCIIRDQIFFTIDPQKAKVFQKDDKNAAVFMRSLGLEKHEISPDDWFTDIWLN